MSKYRSTWHLTEFTQVFVVRYRDPLNKKRFAIPYKDQKSANDKMAQLKRDGVKEIEVTKDMLRGNIKFKEEVDLQEFTKSQIDMLKKNYEPMRGKTISPQKASMLSGIMDRQFSDISSLKQLAKADIPFVSTLAKNKLYKKTGKFEDTDNERIAALRAKQMMKQTKIREMDPAKDKDKIAIAKNDIETIELRMDAIKNKMQKEMLDIIDESIKSDDDYQAKKKALQDIQNDPKMRDPETKAALMKRKDKLEKDYAEFKSKNKIAASKEFEKDLVAESPAAKEIDRTNTRRDSMDYQMYKKSAELLRKKDYKALGKHIHKSDTAPREYVMNVINKKEPATFKKIYGNQTGFLATMKPLNMGEADLTKGQIKKVHKMADELPKKDFKDRYGKEKGDSVRYATATNIVKKKEGIKEMQQIDEKIEGLKNKSEKSGIPYGILKQVYNRGMAAWKGGHRPGTTPQQWAFARVNAFITKGKAYYTADADLAKKARAAKKGKK